MQTLYTISVFVHVLAACAWIGAMIFFAVAVVPVVRRPEFRSVFAQLVGGVGARFRVLGWTCLVVLIATGISNLALRGFLPQLAMREFWATDFGRTLAIKLVAVLLVVMATGAHDLLAKRGRRTATWLGRSTLVLSAAVLLLAVWLVRGMP
jgi:putative copper export protein